LAWWHKIGINQTHLWLVNHFDCNHPVQFLIVTVAVKATRNPMPKAKRNSRTKQGTNL